MFQRLGNLSLWIASLIIIVIAALAFIQLARSLEVPDFSGPPPAAERSGAAEPILPVLESAVFLPTSGSGEFATHVVSSSEAPPEASTFAAAAAVTTTS